MAPTRADASDVPRRLSARGQATRRRIVDAAADLMFQRGVARTSLDHVMVATATSKSQLYHYFRDKDALTEAVVVAQTDRIVAAHEPYLHRLDSIAAIVAWCNFVSETQRRHGCRGGCPLGSLVSELSDVSEHHRRTLERSYQRWERLLLDGLQAMQGRGEIASSVDVGELAAGTMAALQGGLLLSQATRSTRHLEAGLALAVGEIRRHATGQWTQTMPTRHG